MLDLDKRWVLLSLTWPIFIETAMRLLMGNVSIFMISSHSDEAVAAVGVATQIINMLIMIFGIVATGSAILISQLLGAGESRTASQAVVVSLCANLAFGLVVSAAMLFCADDIARLMNVEGQALAYTSLILAVVGGTSFTQAIIATLGAVFRNYGYTKVPMAVALLMNAVNVIGNYVSLYEPFGLPVYGVKGVAVTMAVSALLGAVWIGVIFVRRFDVAALLRLCRPFPVDMLKRIYRIGLPSATESVAYNSSQVVITFLITMLGTEMLATRIYAYNITTFVYILGLSIGMGTQILVGHLIGAGRSEQAYRLTNRNLTIAMVSNIAFSLILIAFAEPIFRLYTDNEAIIRIGTLVLFIDIFVEMGRALNHIGNGSLRGAGDVKYPMVVNVLSMWCIGVALCYAFGLRLEWGLAGVWIALAMDEWARGLALMLRWRSRIWERAALVKRDGKHLSA